MNRFSTLLSLLGVLALGAGVFVLASGPASGGDVVSPGHARQRDRQALNSSPIRVLMQEPEAREHTTPVVELGAIQGSFPEGAQGYVVLDRMWAQGADGGPAKGSVTRNTLGHVKMDGSTDTFRFSDLEPGSYDVEYRILHAQNSYSITRTQVEVVEPTVYSIGTGTLGTGSVSIALHVDGEERNDVFSQEGFVRLRIWRGGDGSVGGTSDLHWYPVSGPLHVGGLEPGPYLMSAFVPGLPFADQNVQLPFSQNFTQMLEVDGHQDTTWSVSTEAHRSLLVVPPRAAK